jgi:3-oxoacid CoA-transferase subunit A
MRGLTFALADLHGDFKPVRELEKAIKDELPYAFDADEPRRNALILLGDTGANFFFNHRDENLKEKLGKYDFTYFVIRGNHDQRASICMQDNTEAWDVEEFWGNLVYVEKAYPYIKYAMDTPSCYHIPYTTYPESDELHEGDPIEKTFKTLVIPGAYSVDKYHRLQMGWSWFESEQLTEKEMEDTRQYLENIGKDFDLVLSHTCPIIFEPTDLFLPTVDQSMVDKSMERFLGELEYKLNYTAWMWGHYHATRDYPRTDGRKKLMLYNEKAVEVSEYILAEEVIYY